MIEAALGIAKDELKNIDVPYEFMRWTSEEKPDRYWVGEYLEIPTDTEDGYEEGTLILTGTTEGLWAVLIQDRTKIKDHFPTTCEFRKATENGAVVIFYENLHIKMWKGMK